MSYFVRYRASAMSLVVFASCAREASAPNGVSGGDNSHAETTEPPSATSTAEQTARASAAPKPAPAPTATDANETSDANELTDLTAAPGTTLAGAQGTATATPQAAPEVSFAAHYPSERAVRLLAWKREHHVKGPGFDQQCWELGGRVGTPPAPGLLCLVVSRKPLFTLGRIYRVESGRLREVWQATLATYANWLELTPLFDADGTLALHDHRPGSCEAALREYHAKLDAMVAPPSGELLGAACAKRGRYAYEQGKYRLVEPVPLGQLESPTGL